MTLRFALTYLQGQFRSLRLLYDKKAKQWMSSWLELKVSVGVYRIVSGPLSVFIGVVIVNTWSLVSVVAHGPLVSYFFPENRISFFMQNSQKIWFNISCWGDNLQEMSNNILWNVSCKLSPNLHEMSNPISFVETKKKKKEKEKVFQNVVFWRFVSSMLQCKQKFYPINLDQFT